MIECGAKVDKNPYGVDAEKCSFLVYMSDAARNVTRDIWPGRNCQFPNAEGVNAVICPVSKWYHGSMSLGEAQEATSRLRTS